MALVKTSYSLRRVVEEKPDINVGAVAANAFVRFGDREAAPSLNLLERFKEQPYVEFSVRSAVARVETR